MDIKNIEDDIFKSKEKEKFSEIILKDFKNIANQIGIDIKQIGVNYFKECEIEEFKTSKFGLRVDEILAFPHEVNYKMYFVFDKDILKLKESRKNIMNNQRTFSSNYKLDVNIKIKEGNFKVLGLFPMFENEYFYCTYDMIQSDWVK